MDTFPSLSTDQLAAFVELSRQGSLRAAAEKLFITEQGIRNRLVALEGQLRTELYRKRRGAPSGGQLTEQGMRLLPLAVQLLEQASAAFEALHGPSGTREVHVAASQYLILYVLIDVVRTFHARNPDIRIRLSSHTEQQIEAALLADPALALGVAAPYEPSAELEYQHLLSLDWHLITPPRHPLLRKRGLSLKQLADVPLILLERGSSGRQHVVDAFHGEGVSPRIDMETTNTEIIVRMVEAGLGISIVPLLPNGAVTRGHKVGIRPLTGRIRPIRSGILTRRGETPSAATRQFVEFVRAAALGSRE